MCIRDRKNISVIHDRCAEIDRDPASLSISIHLWWQQANDPGAKRSERIAAYGELGVSRVQLLVRNAATDDGALEAFAEDCRTAGVQLAIGALV